LGDKNEAKNRHPASTKNKTEAAEKALFLRLSPATSSLPGRMNTNQVKNPLQNIRTFSPHISPAKKDKKGPSKQVKFQKNTFKFGIFKTILASKFKLQHRQHQNTPKYIVDKKERKAIYGISMKNSFD